MSLSAAWQSRSQCMSDVQDDEIATSLQRALPGPLAPRNDIIQYIFCFIEKIQRL